MILAASLCAIAFTTNAQTKGTNTLGFGVTASNFKSESNETENKTNSYSIGYGNFIKDNTRIGFDLNYSKLKTSQSNNTVDFKNYGGNLTYQKYFPLVKTLYAYAGGRAGYAYGEQDNSSSTQSSTYITNSYNVGAFGGITWFLSKRFAFETSLLSANAVYAKTKQKNNAVNNYNNFDSKQTSFNLNTEGFINDLGFKIYILF